MNEIVQNIQTILLLGRGYVKRLFPPLFADLHWIVKIRDKFHHYSVLLVGMVDVYDVEIRSKRCFQNPEDLT